MHGVMKIPKLFNTISHSKLTVSMKSALSSDPTHISQDKIMYPITDLPESFDPRIPNKELAADIYNHWFYAHIENGKLDRSDIHTILAVPLDQAACGSCWAFSTSYMFTCRIRMALLKRYKEQACVMSPFFQHMDICTGESNVESGSDGVTNAGNSSMSGEEVKNRISAYYTAAFAPKPLDPSPESCVNNPKIDECSQSKCVDALAKSMSQNKDIYDILKEDPNMHQLCLGCGGNFVALALTLFCGHPDDNTKGAAKISDFTIYNWACMFGTPSVRKLFCEKGHKEGDETKDLIRYKADRFSYIINPKEDQIMYEIVNYGPVSVGYTVYNSFFTFFSNPSNRSKVYTADIANEDPEVKGGHAVCIVGWGTDDNGVKYWLLANSWGSNWGDSGFFRVERGINLCGFEDAIGGVYFAPDPNVQEADTLYPEYATSNGMNDMKMYLSKSKYSSCPHPSDDKSHLKEVAEKCKKCLVTKDGKCIVPDVCPHAQTYNPKSGKCEKSLLGAHRSYIEREHVKEKKSSNMLFFLIVIFGIAYYIYKKRK